MHERINAQLLICLNRDAISCVKNEIYNCYRKHISACLIYLNLPEIVPIYFYVYPVCVSVRACVLYFRSLSLSTRVYWRQNENFEAPCLRGSPLSQRESLRDFRIVRTCVCQIYASHVCVRVCDILSAQAERVYFQRTVFRLFFGRSKYIYTTKTSWRANDVVNRRRCCVRSSVEHGGARRDKIDECFLPPRCSRLYCVIRALRWYIVQARVLY